MSLLEQQISHYKILTHLGAGGMGEVYLAQDTTLDRKVAIKVLPDDLVADEQAKKRLVREARAAATLDHPNICSIYEVGEADGRNFIVMQYVGGETLDARMKKTPLALPEILSISNQVAEALSEAHAHGIIHRDIKPANIIVSARGQAKVMDFGLAKSVPRALDSEAKTQSMLTDPGTVLGTLPYMSPEQVRGEEVDLRSDLFSFGTMVYEMVSGRQPFAGASAAATASAILTHEPLPLIRFAPDVPDELQRIVRKCLDKDREHRYQSARDLEIDLKNIRRQSESLQAQPSPPATPINPPRSFRSWRPVFAALALVALLGAGLVYFWAFRRPGANAVPTIQSLAVLPLGNLSGDSAQEYFADGMTEALTTELARLGALRVISRTSAMQYKGARKSLPEIANELKVDGIVEGSVLRSGQRVKIDVKLIRAGSDEHLWANTYVRDLTDILVLQSDVARDIAKQVQIKLSSSDTARLSNAAKVNPEAHDAYLRGRFYWSKGEREDLETARKHFEEALLKDPRYAPAYAGLADYYSVLPFYTNARPDEVFPKAKENVAKALEFDSSLAEAHGTKAYISTYYDWDWQTAEQEFQRSLALNPNDGTLRHRYSRYLSSVGRVTEALAEIERARLLDPSDLVIKANVGVIYFFDRQYDRAIEELQKVLRDYPDFSTAHWGLGLAFAQKGKYEQALPEVEKAAQRRGTNSLASLGHIYGLMGRKKEARDILSELKKRGEERDVSDYQLALVYIGLDEKDAAIEALEQAYRERSTLMTYLKMDPRLDSLRSNPKFQDLLRNMNFPQ
jgi:eukaryotic-like serine/threonine-protein kinase